MPDLVLFQPDIPGNTGTLIRLVACVGVRLHIIEPAGFRLDDRTLKRAGMDYRDMATLIRHVSWDAFQAWRESEQRRLLLLTTKSQTPYTETRFETNDLLLFGRESTGAPPHVHEAADQRLTIPMVEGVRSLNLAVSASMVLGEALRQTRWSGPTTD